MQLDLVHFHLCQESGDERFLIDELALEGIYSEDIAFFVQPLSQFNNVRSLYLTPNQEFHAWLLNSGLLHADDQVYLGSPNQRQSDIQAWEEHVKSEGLELGPWFGLGLPWDSDTDHLSLKDLHSKARVRSALKKFFQPGVHAKQVGRLSNGLKRGFLEAGPFHNGQISMRQSWLEAVSAWVCPNYRQTFKNNFIENTVPGLSLYYCICD